MIYTPRTLELFIHEVLFYFVEIAIAAKVSMSLLKRKEILEAFDLLDCEFFKGDDEVSKKIVEDSVKKYSTIFRTYEISCNIMFAVLIVIPLVLISAFGADRVLPVAKYYFLSDEIREKYFWLFYAYQSFCVYTNMSYNNSNDPFIAGLMWMAITQLRVIKHKLYELKLGSTEQHLDKRTQDEIMYNKLVQCLKHYQIYLEYYSNVQAIIDFAMFVTFGVAGCVICIILCALTILPLSESLVIVMVFYLCAIVTEIFIPAWIGTQLTHNAILERCQYHDNALTYDLFSLADITFSMKMTAVKYGLMGWPESTFIVSSFSLQNQDLAFAVYNSDWIPRSEKFKRSLRLLVERANKPMILMGCKIFPLSLKTFFATYYHHHWPHTSSVADDLFSI
ncbi:7tm odorant receptor domain-containing protein [Phthorimaea operculella]|nr:7tm odorant receptor domain-containing protein [Phthorimaea operculella]